MAADLRYMKQPRHLGYAIWFFVYNIPTDLRGLPQFRTSRGKPMTKITESLGTTDSEKARDLRDQRVLYWRRQFRMLREGPSEDDIREEAVEVYRAALKAKEAQPDWGPTHLERTEDYLRLLDNAISVQVAKEITAFCEHAGVSLEPGTEPYRKVGIKFIEAKIAARAYAWLPTPEGRTIRSDHQHLPPLPKIEPPIPSEPKPLPIPQPTLRHTELFSEAFEKYLATQLDGTRPVTIAEYRRKVGIFTKKVGDLPLTKITDHMAVAFLDDYLLGERKQTPTTRNSYATLFSSIYKSAIRRKKVAVNPFEGQRVKQNIRHYESFTNEEIVLLFSDAKFEIAPAKRNSVSALPWASLISAYTGCRLEEVARLRVADIKETDGIWYFEFCPDGNGKTKAATRVVPLHRALIDAGLLRYCDALPKNSMLFPGLKDRGSKPGKLGPKIGDAFNRWRKRLGIVRSGVNFHSFRHSVGDRLRKAGVPEDDRAALLGHEDERITSRVYGHDGPGLPRLQKIVDKISYTAASPMAGQGIVDDLHGSLTSGG
jgi:integrase